MDASVAGPVAKLAMFRAGLGPVSAYASGYLSIFSEKDVSQIVLGYKDNGILYRTSLIDVPTLGEDQRDYSALVREISNTLTFIKNQYKELVVDLLMVGGEYGRDERFQQALGEATSLKTLEVNPWETWGIHEPDDGQSTWEGAIGLAVRDLI